MIISALSNSRFPNKQELSGNRWAEWAKSFAKRFRLASLNRQKMTIFLRVAHVGAANVSFISQWDRFFQQVSPRIHLAVGCLLREIVLREGPGSSSGVLGRPASWPILDPFPGKQAFTREGGADYGSYGDAMNGGTSLVQRVFARVNPETEPSPVQRVFARASSDPEPDQLTVQRVNATTLLTKTCHRVMRRALEVCERVEERRTQSLILRREERGSSVVQQDGGLKDATTYSPWGPSVGQPAFMKMTTPMSIDLDRLTDQVVRQIDNKIVAHRERMGKVF